MAHKRLFWLVQTCGWNNWSGTGFTKEEAEDALISVFERRIGNDWEGECGFNVSLSRDKKLEALDYYGLNYSLLKIGNGYWDWEPDERKLPSGNSRR
jgi:hypothetical protein